MSEQPDLHTLTGAYVTDALDPAELQDFESHLQECDACRQEVAELRATVSRLAAATETAPPPSMRARVLAEVGRTRQLPPPVRHGTPVAGSDVVALPPRWWQQPVAVAAAFLLVLAAGLGAYGLTQQRRADQAEERADRITAIVTSPDRVQDSAAAASGGSGTVVAADGAAVVRLTGLRSLPSDRTYQLWLISDGQASSAGLLGGSGDAQTVLDRLDGADALGVTVEPAGGSSAPTSDIVLQLDIAS